MTPKTRSIPAALKALASAAMFASISRIRPERRGYAWVPVEYGPIR